MPPPPRARAKLPALTVDAAPAVVKERPPRPKPAPLPPSNAAALAALRAGDKKPLADPSRKESQDKVGNGAVAAGLARSPGADPKFAVLKKDVAHKKHTVAKSHPPANKEATSAQAASVPPKDDEVAQGKTANAEKMNEAKPKDFDKEAFVKAVEKAIAEKAPKNLEEADEFSESGKPAEVKAEVADKVGEGKNDSAEQIADTTAAPPDTSAAEVKQVVPMTGDRPPGTPATPDPAKATPDKLPPSATDMSAGPAAVDKQLAENQVTEKQLSTDPAFSPALKDKKAAEKHSEATPPELRKNESQQLHQTTAQAKHFGASAMGAITARRAGAGRLVDRGKEATKSDDQDKRAKVTAILQKVFDTMKTDVEGILTGLDKLVDDQFTKGEKEARDAFTAEHRRKMDEYKDRRYSGGWGLVKWGHDKLFGLPEEANRIFVEARDHYVKAMRTVISGVADTIGRELTRAKQRIATGRTELQKAVDSLPKDLKALGKEAAAGFADKFDELTQSVDDKSTELVDTLATKYTDAVKAVDAEIAEEKEKNKGLVDKALDAVKGVIKTILELKDMLLGVLAKAAHAVMGILRDPIGFLGNLVSAVGGGLKQFKNNAVTHLQQGVLSWLLGTAATAGIELPKSFDAASILLMIASLLGLSWANLRARIARKVPKEAMAAIEAGEHALPIVLEVRKRGIRALWDDLRDRVGDLKKTLIDNLVSYLLPTIIMAGITWIISLFNPASAFIRACKMIIDIIKFIVTNGRQIIEFVNTVLDAVIAIAKGGAGGVAGLVEKALARSIPVLIGALAALLGIGGIAGKVKEIFQKLARPVNKAIDWVIGKIVGLAKKVWAKLKALGKKVKDKFSKKPEKTPSKDEPRPDSKRPTVKVPFAMAGESHTLTLAPHGDDVQVTMASTQPHDLETMFSRAHSRLIFFKHYIESIKDPGIKQRYEEHILPSIDSFVQEHVMTYRAIYKKWYPGPSARPQREPDALAAIRDMTDAAQLRLQNLNKWAAKTGIADLSPERIDETINTKGWEIWEQEWLSKKKRIADIVGGFKYNSNPISYRGSVLTGFRGRQKGLTAFNVRNFDVDMYVVDAADFNRIVTSMGGRARRSWIAGDAVHAPELLRLSTRVSAALGGEFPEVEGIGDSKVVLRRTEPG
ncbi:hypothetical protein Amsp01_060650 [Amycolatopsis sp. NBRC 101858]|uniref:hypothetical protein n=1 Tax=Amycolatopsis sp. NBRC 101858 TaxID=3032200 RepID=UPI0024A278DF|nr:hypothetical protein [Amycolatopsis sp. NBRC 101858]GLY40042.1 hypothetical protein Amsp01_060650 [Amycolatopsis sp. NBRC 101858]